MLAADALHRALSALAGSGERLRSRPSERERVLVALSGGVDSAVAALREREPGGTWSRSPSSSGRISATDGERSCCSPEAVLGARRVAHSLGIPHLTLDLEREFRAGVVGPFLQGYAEGRTPNPCVLCNGELRIDAMIALADRLGAAKLVTGHYARIADDGSGPLLAGAADDAKDQTYMLSALRPASLERLRFPLAELTKPEVRELAERAGLEVAGPRREPGPLLPRRARESASSCAATPGSRTGRARSSTARGAASARTTATTTSPSASAGARTWAAASRSTCWRPTPPPTASIAGRPGSARHAPGPHPGRQAPPRR